MPVYKFRHVADMKDTAWRQPGDPALFRAIRGTWTLADRTARARFPGVYKYVSSEVWEQANFDAFRARRKDRR